MSLSCAACAGGRAVRSLCVQAVSSGLSGVAALTSDESTLEVCIHDHELYKSTFFTGYLYLWLETQKTR